MEPDFGVDIAGGDVVLGEFDRLSWRRAELDRVTGRIDPDVPDLAAWPKVGSKDEPLPAAKDAFRGPIPVMRRGWLAKFRPGATNRRFTFGETDVWDGFPWSDVQASLRGPWLGPWLLGAQKRLQPQGSGAPQVAPGDLVFLMRTGHHHGDLPPLARKVITGVTWVESVATHYAGDDGTLIAAPNATLFPLRRFDFPVPIREVSQHDKSGFGSIRAFHDDARRGLLELDPDELVAMTRACGLPAAVLTEPVPNNLARHVAGLTLGPPERVQRRIEQGARAVEHRRAVEEAAIWTVMRSLQRSGMAVRSIELCRGDRGYGADLVASCVEHGATRHRLVEVKGLSSGRWKEVHITRHQRLAAQADADAGTENWWLAVVTDALSGAAEVRWLSARAALDWFTVESGDGRTWSVP